MVLHVSESFNQVETVIKLSGVLAESLSRCEVWVGDSDDAELEIQTDVREVCTGCIKAWVEHLRQVGLDWFG